MLCYAILALSTLCYLLIKISVVSLTVGHGFVYHQSCRVIVWQAREGSRVTGPGRVSKPAEIGCTMTVGSA
jgi:hypothetical protein